MIAITLSHMMSGVITSEPIGNIGRLNLKKP